ISEGEFAACTGLSSLDAFLVLSTSGVFPGYYLCAPYLIQCFWENLNLPECHVTQLVKGGNLALGK
ncbi:uncharacterized protein METZ01_LOCUS179883, partial [marine metagenome]